MSAGTSNFPTSLDNNAVADNTTEITSTLYNNHSKQIEALEAKVGIDSSVVATSLDYLVKNTNPNNVTFSHANGININTISERTAGSGVTIDGVICKDSKLTAAGDVQTDHILENSAGHGVDVDGLNIKDSKINTANSVDSDCYVDGSIDGEHISTSAFELGYTQVTSTQGSITTLVDLTNLSLNVTVPNGGRKVKITGRCLFISTVANDIGQLIIRDESNNQLGTGLISNPSTVTSVSLHAEAVITPTAGAHTYKLSMLRAAGTGTCSMVAGAAPLQAYIHVEVI